MKNSLFIAIIFTGCLLSACGGAGDNSSSTNAIAQKQETPKPQVVKTKEQLVTNIETLTKEIYDTKAGENKFNFDTNKAQELVNTYETFMKAFPNEAEVPQYLFKSAEIYRSLRNFNKSNYCYTQLLSKYPDYEKTPHSLFLMGFSYENDMNNTEKAREIYTQFLEKYPSHELKDDVEFSLNNLGKTPEEIIKAFEASKPAS